MATGFDSDFAFLQKILFPGGYDSKALVKDKPFLANTPHKKNFTTGRGMEIPAPYSTPQGASAAAATAASNASPSKGSSFTVPQTSYYAQLRLDGKLVANAKNGTADTQFVDQMKYETDMVEDTIGWELERQGFGSNTGYRAIIGSFTASTDSTITLATTSDAIFFRPNMVVVFVATGSGAGGAVRTGGSTNVATVSAVNTRTGVLTFTAQNITTTCAVANSDYIYRQGDAQNGGTAKVCAGLADWNPTSDPTSTAFYGVDRSVNPQELGGVRYDASGDMVQTAFINARASFMTQIGKGLPKGVFYIHPLYAAAMRNAFEAKRIIDSEKNTTYDIGIDTFKIDGNTFVEAAACPYGYARYVADGAFVRASCGDQPSWSAMGQGDMFWLDRDNDLVKGMMAHYGNFAAWHVNELMVVTLPAI